MSEKALNILALGSAALDVITVVERLPYTDEKMPVSIVHIDAGGAAATAAATATRLGIKVHLAAVVGDDEAGDLICKLNLRDQVDMVLIERQRGGSSPISIAIANHSDARAIIWSRGDMDAYPVTKQLLEKDKTSDLLMMDGIEMGVSLALASGRLKRGALNLLDAGTLREGMVELAQFSQLVGMSKRFATQFNGSFDPRAAIVKMRSLGPEFVVTTDGVEGCWGMGSDGILLHQPAFPVEVVDTTGAGDIFHGTWSVTKLKGMSWPQQLRFAAGAAALGCCRPGGRAGIPNWLQLEEFVCNFPHLIPQEVK